MTRRKSPQAAVVFCRNCFNEGSLRQRETNTKHRYDVKVMDLVIA